MYEKELTLDEFSKLEDKDGFVYFFTSDSCGLCKEYEKHITPYRIPKMIKVRGTENELVDRGIIFTPLTIIYQNGKPFYKKAGVLFDKQIRELKDKMVEVGILG